MKNRQGECLGKNLRLWVSGCGRYVNKGFRKYLISHRENLKYGVNGKTMTFLPLGSKIDNF